MNINEGKATHRVLQFSSACVSRNRGHGKSAWGGRRRRRRRKIVPGSLVYAGADWKRGFSSGNPVRKLTWKLRARDRTRGISLLRAPVSQKFSLEEGAFFLSARESNDLLFTRNFVPDFLNSKLQRCTYKIYILFFGINWNKKRWFIRVNY